MNNRSFIIILNHIISCKIQLISQSYTINSAPLLKEHSSPHSKNRLILILEKLVWEKKAIIFEEYIRKLSVEMKNLMEKSLFYFTIKKFLLKVNPYVGI